MKAILKSSAALKALVKAANAAQDVQGVAMELITEHMFTIELSSSVVAFYFIEKLFTHKDAIVKLFVK